MNKNVGNIDRIFRIIIGFVLLSLVFIIDNNYRWFGLIGIIPLFTAFIGYCPAYQIFGISSCKLKK